MTNTSSRRVTLNAVLILCASATLARFDAPVLIGQSADSHAAAKLSFDVASIKTNTSGDVRASMQPFPGGRFSATNVPLRAVIRFAYDVQDFQLDAAPAWLASTRYDIVAKADGDPKAAEIRLMLQSLLADRFGLRVHDETRELPAYDLVMAKSDRRLGPRLRRTTADCSGDRGAVAPGRLPEPGQRPSCGYIGPTPGADLPSGRITMSFRGLTIGAFGRFLMPILRRTVIDRTGLTGYFDGDFDPSVEFPPPPPPPGLPDPFDRPAFPSLFTVLGEQLGLKLNSTKAPTAIVVIDRVEKPTED